MKEENASAQTTKLLISDQTSGPILAKDPSRSEEEEMAAQAFFNKSSPTAALLVSHDPICKQPARYDRGECGYPHCGCFDRNSELTQTTAEAIARLVRWRDVGDGPDTYCAGGFQFGHDVRDALAEIEDLRTSVIAFGAPWAVKYAEDWGLPPKHLDPRHYDILKRAGARMDDFIRGSETNV